MGEGETKSKVGANGREGETWNGDGLQVEHLRA
jgi:hypothetical protein